MEITNSAVEQFKKMLKDEGGKDSGIRVFVSGGGCCGTSFGIDIAEKGEPEDKTVIKDGVKIFVAQDAKKMLVGVTIDCHMGRLIIRGLTSSSSCCG